MHTCKYIEKNNKPAKMHLGNLTAFKKTSRRTIPKRKSMCFCNFPYIFANPLPYIAQTCKRCCLPTYSRPTIPFKIIQIHTLLYKFAPLQPIQIYVNPYKSMQNALFFNVVLQLLLFFNVFTRNTAIYSILY